MLLGFHHIALLASDEEKSVCFYRAFGFSVSKRYERPDRGDTVLMLQNGNMTLELFIQKELPPRVTNPEAYGLRHLALKTEDAPALRNALLQKGFWPEELRTDAFTGEKMFFIKDPDGQPIEVHE